ncbi:2 aminoethanethiol dioxygenase [Fasciolopsis buskii]|uniref:2 aminoethanethiol dioxygenase n=1 Tax=Fasciolopsis buskii TaxID=27845 RepID=A0A8E0VHL3_9TREM|nr:2 aminoethanethiol dioxygenase [Fasciolopsis buski]
MARPHQDVVVSAESCEQLLTPEEGNLHEVTPVDGPAVILDILAHPYDHDLGTRECRFYKDVILLGNHVPKPPADSTASIEIGPNAECASNQQHSDVNDVHLINVLRDGSQLI